jgi:hypothetical protein
LVIVAEDALCNTHINLIWAASAAGYAVMAAGGEGNRNVRCTGEPSGSHALSNVKSRFSPVPANWLI